MYVPTMGRTAHDEQQPDVHFSLDAVADEAHKAHYEPYDEVGTCGYKGVYPEESDDYRQTDASENQTYRSTNQPYNGAGKPLYSGLAWSYGSFPFGPVPGRPSGCAPESDDELYSLPDDETSGYGDQGTLRNGCRAGKPSNKGPYGRGDAHKGHEPPIYPPSTDVPVASYKGA